eukprot:1557661-Pleurochrysis_carterae.AAC.1
MRAISCGNECMRWLSEQRTLPTVGRSAAPARRSRSWGLRTRTQHALGYGKGACASRSRSKCSKCTHGRSAAQPSAA